MKKFVLFALALSGAVCAQNSPDPADAFWQQAVLYRDEWGVPHIYADNKRAMAFAFGYAQAEDHLEAMLLAYRMANGRAAEVLGEASAASDELAIRLAHAELAYEAAEEKRRGRRLAIGAAVLVLVVQVAATVMALSPAPHNGGDNAGYLSLAHSLVTDGSYVEQWDPEARPHTKYPPVDPTILAGAMVLGAEGWGAFKAISVFFIVVSVFVTFLWALDRRGPRFALVLALLNHAQQPVLLHRAGVRHSPV